MRTLHGGPVPYTSFYQIAAILVIWKITYNHADPSVSKKNLLHLT